MPPWVQGGELGCLKLVGAPTLSLKPHPSRLLPPRHDASPNVPRNVRGLLPGTRRHGGGRAPHTTRNRLILRGVVRCRWCRGELKIRWAQARAGSSPAPGTMVPRSLGRVARRHPGGRVRSSYECPSESRESPCLLPRALRGLPRRVRQRLRERGESRGRPAEKGLRFERDGWRILSCGSAPGYPESIRRKFAGLRGRRLTPRDDEGGHALLRFASAASARVPVAGRWGVRGRGRDRPHFAPGPARRGEPLAHQDELRELIAVG
jgi:hypothetical protein